MTYIKAYRLIAIVCIILIYASASHADDPDSIVGIWDNEDKDARIEIFRCGSQEIRSYRGNRIAMIFQEPMISLNPVYPIGHQLIEPLLLHRSMSKSAARSEAIRLLERTGIEDPDERLHVFPHQLSGGQRQRVMIAMALACRPDLLIADEPTTALDVTIQAQILAVIKDIQQEYRMAVLLITHDLAMVSKMAASIHIMKEGTIVEHGRPAGSSALRNIPIPASFWPR